MRKLLALVATLAMVLSMFTGIAFAAPAAGNYVVNFATGASTNAGATSKLEFVITPNAATTTLNIDLKTSGFVPVGAAVVVNDATSAAIASVTNLGATDLTITFAATAVAMKVTVPVRNPLVAQQVDSATAFAVTDPAAVNNILAAGAAGRALNVTYTVTPSVASGVAGAPANVTFTVTQNGTVVTLPMSYTITRASDSAAVSSGTTNNGTFAATLPFSLAAGVMNDTYNVAVTAGATLNGTTTVAYKYALTVTGLDNVKVNETRAISGKVLDAAGNAVATTVQIKDKVAGTVVGVAATAAGSFSMNSSFMAAGTYQILVGGAVYQEFTVAGEALTLTLDKTTVVNTLGNTNVVATVKVPGMANPPTGAAQIRLLKPDGTEYTTWTDAALVDTDSVAGNDAFRVTFTVLAAAAVGTYTVEARWDTVGPWGATTVADRAASTTFVVQTPGKLNATVSATVLDANGSVQVGAGTVVVVVRDAAGAGWQAAPTASQIKKVVFTVTGPLTSTVTFDSSATGAAFDNPGVDTTKTVNINVETAGTITVNGTVTFGDGTTQDFSKTYTTNGWNIVTNAVLGTVGDVVTLQAVITDAAGNPVNNAAVTWKTNAAKTNFYTVKASDGTWNTLAGTVTVDGQSVNINNGVYAKEVKLAAAETGMTLQVVQSGTAVNRVVKAVKINGQTAYNVTTAQTQLLATLNAQTLRVFVKDLNGATVTNLQNLDITGSTGVLAGALNIGNATAQDTNSDGITDAFDFSVSPLATGTLTITAGTDTNNKIGSTTVSVVAPNVTVSLGDKVTESVREKLTVTVNDKNAAGTAYPVTVRISPVGSYVKVDTDVAVPVNVFANANAGNYTTGAAVEHKLLVTAYDDAANTTVAPVVKVEVSYNGGANYVTTNIAVTPLNITVSPESIFVGGVNKVDVNVKDAHGVAYANKTVTLAGSATGTTDANGNVTLFITPNSTGSATISVTTDGTAATKNIPVTIDNVKPELTITSATAVTAAKYVLKGTFSDNLKVTSIYVNGQSVPFIAETGEFEYTTTLTAGDNTFTVFAFDAANNGAKQEVSVALNAATQTVLQGSTVSRHGEYVYVQIRQFEALGATLNWNQSTNTATFTCNGKTVEVQVGSTTAKVNGVAVTMPAAPINNNGRVEVPTRFIAESLGWTVNWAPGDIVTIVLP